MGHLARELEQSGLMMFCAKAMKRLYHSVYTQDGKYTTVNTVKMLVLFVLVSLTSNYLPPDMSIYTPVTAYYNLLLLF